MTKLERKIRNLNKQVEIFMNEIIKPLAKCLKPIWDLTIEALKPIQEVLQHECYRCYDYKLCELHDLDYPIINCKYFKDKGKELEIINE